MNRGIAFLKIFLAMKNCLALLKGRGTKMMSSHDADAFTYEDHFFRSVSSVFHCLISLTCFMDFFRSVPVLFKRDNFIPTHFKQQNHNNSSYNASSYSLCARPIPFRSLLFTVSPVTFYVSPRLYPTLCFQLISGKRMIGRKLGMSFGLGLAKRMGGQLMWKKRPIRESNASLRCLKPLLDAESRRERLME
jgi:hypothetical protein